MKADVILALANVRLMWRRWFGLLALVTIACALCVTGLAIGDNVSAVTHGGIAESTVNRSITVQRDIDRPESLRLTQTAVADFRRLPHVRDVEPMLQVSFGYKGPGVPGALLYGTTPRAALLPPIVSATRDTVFPLRPGEAIVPARADGYDLSSLEGKTIDVEITRKTGEGVGVGQPASITVVGLFDPSWQVDGRDSAYVDGDTLVDWAAMDAGVTADTFQRTIGYQQVTVMAEHADDVPEVLRAIQTAGFSASALQQQLDALPSMLTLITTLSHGLVIALAIAALAGTVVTARSLVRARTSEIGLLKAVGYSNRDVFSIFVGEFAVVGLMGAVLGTVLGTGGAIVLTGLLRGNADLREYLPTVLALPSAGSVVMVLALAVAVVLVGAGMPAARAARMDPIAAIGHW